MLHGKGDQDRYWYARYGQWQPLHRGLNSKCPSVFRGKACMYVREGIYSLRSYGTIVFQCEPATGGFRRCWDGWSKSTSKHLEYFLREVCPDAHPPSKKEWEDLKVQSTIFIGCEEWRSRWERTE